jgi:hypothetical protein
LANDKSAIASAAASRPVLCVLGHFQAESGHPQKLERIGMFDPSLAIAALADFWLLASSTLLSPGSRDRCLDELIEERRLSQATFKRTE